MVNAIAIALSTNSTTLASFPYVGVKSAISAEEYEIVILTNLEPRRPSRVGLDQEITEDLQGRRWTSYTSQSQTLALSFFKDYPYAAMLIPLKLAVDDQDKWITQKRKMKRTYTWLDFLSSIGGTLPFATGIYYLLFGVGRVRTWGIIQNFFLRRKVLSQVPDSALAIPNYERIGGKIYSDVTQPNYEKSLVAIDMPMQQLSSSPSRVDRHSVESRLAQLEAFQQRLDVFYLSHDIFESKKRKESH
ncbi:hypothetical protein K7432_015789 [Basidiobolus ranarum]|uniref:Transmembrane protein n=1 Tax=Basidiobolus ranarum TaxID=34480 RepID=A0ABR2WFQ6_9FUNG